MGTKIAILKKPKPTTQWYAGNYVKVEFHLEIGDNLEPKQQRRLYDSIQLNAEIITFGTEKLGKTNVLKHRIDTGSNEPFNMAPYRVSHSQRKEICDQVDEMLSLGVIKPSKSPYASPVLLVKKKDGKHRFCIYFRKLNTMTVKDKYPLPNIEDIISMLHGSKIFKLIDMNSGVLAN